MRGADIADETEIELAAAAEIFRADIDLRDLRSGRQKLLVGKSVPNISSTSQACIAA